MELHAKADAEADCGARAGLIDRDLGSEGTLPCGDSAHLITRLVSRANATSPAVLETKQSPQQVRWRIKNLSIYWIFSLKDECLVERLERFDAPIVGVYAAREGDLPGVAAEGHYR